MTQWLVRTDRSRRLGRNIHRYVCPLISPAGRLVDRNGTLSRSHEVVVRLGKGHAPSALRLQDARRFASAYGVGKSNSLDLSFRSLRPTGSWWPFLIPHRSLVQALERSVNLSGQSVMTLNGLATATLKQTGLSAKAAGVVNRYCQAGCPESEVQRDVTSAPSDGCRPSARKEFPL
jgi:hypothetical protein